MIKYCLVCDKSFEVTKKDRNRKYCSIECQHKSMQTYKYDINNPPKCMFCQTVLPHRKANSGYKFCNVECRRKYNEYQKQLKFNFLPNKHCEICNTLLSKQQILDNRRVCSPKCAYQLRVNLYGDVSEANPDKFIQYACINELRKTEEYKDRAMRNMHKLWQNDDFRSKKIDYMKTNNPVYRSGVVEKANATKESKGILHTWVGDRGGNGKISECEQLIYDFCISLGFEYNKAISTYSLRLQYPEKHYGFNYKPDFTNERYKLCVEIDGKTHTLSKGKLIDSKKEFCLTTLGYTVMRFSNEAVKTDIEKIKQTIINKLIELGWCKDG